MRMPQPLKPERRGSQATAWLALAALLLLLCVGSVSLVPGRTALFKSQRSRSDAWMGDGLRRHNALSAAAVPTCLTKPGRCTELLEPEVRVPPRRRRAGGSTGGRPARDAGAQPSLPQPPALPHRSARRWTGCRRGSLRCRRTR